MTRSNVTRNRGIMREMEPRPDQIRGVKPQNPFPDDEPEPNGDSPQDDETRVEAFRRIATARLDRAIAAIRLLGTMGRGGNYKITEHDVDKIERHLAAECVDCVATLRGKRPGFFDE